MTTAATDWGDFEQYADELFETLSPKLVSDILQHAPCRLMSVFDYLLTLPRHSDGDSEDLHLPYRQYHRESDPILLDEQDLVKAALSRRLRIVFLVDALDFSSQISTVKQPIHPYHYTSNWWVVPLAFDNRDDGYTLSINPTPPSFFGTLAKRRLDPAPILRVYLAEYISPPEFHARWAPLALSGNSWVADGLKNESNVAEEAIEHLKRAQKMEADVVLFPELCETPAIGKKIVRWLEDENILEPHEGRHTISLVIPGSHHEKDCDEERWWNISTALDQAGVRVDSLCQRKLTRVNLADYRVTEGIETVSQIGVICSPIGLQATVICLDLAQASPAVKIPLENIPLSWLWVPSLSNSVNAHRLRAKAICDFQPTRIACTNQGPVMFDAIKGPATMSNFPPGASFVFANQTGGAKAIVAAKANEAEGWMLFELPS